MTDTESIALALGVVLVAAVAYTVVQTRKALTAGLPGDFSERPAHTIGRLQALNTELEQLRKNRAALQTG